MTVAVEAHVLTEPGMLFLRACIRDVSEKMKFVEGGPPGRDGLIWTEKPSNQCHCEARYSQ